VFDVVKSVVRNAEPANIKRLGVIVVVSDDVALAANFAWLAGQIASLEGAGDGKCRCASCRAILLVSLLLLDAFPTSETSAPTVADRFCRGFELLAAMLAGLDVHRLALI
jgi:hypothetical protein